MSIWQSDEIRLSPRGAIPHLSHQLDTVYVACLPSSDRSHVCGYRKDNGRQYCSCQYYLQTGKRCAGLWALATMELCGRVAEFESHCLASEATMAGSKSRHKAMANYDDIEDVTRYWASTDVVESPIVALIETNLDQDCSQLVSPEGQSSKLSPVSPIGRRHASARSDTDERSVPLRPATVRGRPPAIRPLQKRRTAQKSSLAIRSQTLPDQGKPVGARNTGTDCFALSLLHILGRQTEWRDAVCAARSDTKDSVLDLFQHFCLSIEQREVRAFPHLQDILISQSSVFLLKMTIS